MNRIKPHLVSECTVRIYSSYIYHLLNHIFLKLFLLQSFLHLSGNKIKWGKSEPTHIPVRPDRTNKGMKYLSINIISPITLIFN